MITVFKNKLLTLIFSLVLGFSIVAFTASAVVVPIAKNAVHDYKKIGCKITSKTAYNDRVELGYIISNNTSSNIASVNISTRVYYQDSYCGSFNTDFSGDITKKKDVSFTVNVSYSLDVFQPLYSHELSELGFRFYLNSVMFEDLTYKDNLDYLIDSVSLNNSKRSEEIEHLFSSEWSYNENTHFHQCLDCGAVEPLVSDEEAHTFNDVITQPTYEHGGYTTHTCTVCGYSFTDNETSSLNHNYSIVWESDETSHWHKCTDPGYESLIGSEGFHTYTDLVVDATFHSEGYTMHTCSVCGYIYIDNNVGLQTITLGEYPQSLVTDQVTIYYLNNSTPDSSGYYTYQGDKYEKVIANPNYDGVDIFDNGDVINAGSTYYFKVEPVQWRCLAVDGSKRLIVSNKLLVSHRFDESSVFYAISEIRSWLNNEFLNKVFNDTSFILTTEVNTNDVIINDKVFLPSLSELSANYFYIDEKTLDESRCFYTTDYARATGCSNHFVSSYYSYLCGDFWTRDKYFNDFVWFCCNGSLEGGPCLNPSVSYVGVLPFLWIDMQLI